MRRALTMAVLVLVAGGCRTLDRASVSLVNVQFADATLLESSVVFTLRVQNQSPEPLTLNGGIHKVYLNGLFIGDAVGGETTPLPGLGSATLPVTAHLSNLRLATRLKPIIESRAFDYRIESLLYTGAGKMRTVSEGRLDMRDFQPSPPTSAL
jgi:LEA14-like dessication related protein